MHNTAVNYAFISTIIKMDKILVNLDTKHQSAQWMHNESHPLKELHVIGSAEKSVTAVFWEADGSILKQYISKDTNVTGNSYLELLKRKLLTTSQQNSHNSRINTITFNITMAFTILPKVQKLQAYSTSSIHVKHRAELNTSFQCHLKHKLLKNAFLQP